MRGIGPCITIMETYFLEINGCDFKTMKVHVEEAAEVCFRRSQIQWEVDFNGFA
jgi:hypothetical protein